MEPRPEIPTSNTIMPRHLAAVLDNLLAAVLALVAAKATDDVLSYQMQFALFVSIYLSYFFAFERILSRTPGKFMTGLVVIRKDGSPMTTRGVLIRTILRVIEVNPILLGYAPAALSIIFSRSHQRIGDRLAGTIVVPPDRVP